MRAAQRPPPPRVGVGAHCYPPGCAGDGAALASSGVVPVGFPQPAWAVARSSSMTGVTRESSGTRNRSAIAIAFLRLGSLPASHAMTADRWYVQFGGDAGLRSVAAQFPEPLAVPVSCHDDTLVSAKPNSQGPNVSDMHDNAKFRARLKAAMPRGRVTALAREGRCVSVGALRLA